MLKTKEICKTEKDFAQEKKGSILEKSQNAEFKVLNVEKSQEHVLLLHLYYLYIAAGSV